MKKTLITKLSQDISELNDDVVEAIKQFMRASFGPANFKAIDFEVVEENEEDILTKLLRSVRSEFKLSDEAGMRIESQGEILQFPVKDAPGEGSDGRPRD